MTKLNPCPFCGKKAEVYDGSAKDCCLCVNKKCLLYARVYPIQLWNIRPVEDKKTAEINYLKKVLDIVGVHDCNVCTIKRLLHEIDMLTEKLATKDKEIDNQNAEIERMEKELDAALLDLMF